MDKNQAWKWPTFHRGYGFRNHAGANSGMAFQIRENLMAESKSTAFVLHDAY
jgi:hypothetical protein